jgi:hypothetical protein
MKAGEDMKTIQELLRHSNFKVTADTYNTSGDSNGTGRADQTGENVLASKDSARKNPEGLFFLLDPSEPSGKVPSSYKFFILLASPTGLF